MDLTPKNLEKAIPVLIENSESIKPQFAQLSSQIDTSYVKQLNRAYSKMEKYILRVIKSYDKQYTITPTSSVSPSYTTAIFNPTGFLGFGSKKKEQKIKDHLEEKGFVKMLLENKGFVISAGAFLALYGSGVALALFSQTDFSPDWFTDIWSSYDNSLRTFVVNRLIFFIYGVASYKFGEVADAYLNLQSKTYKKFTEKFGPNSKVFLGLLIAALAGGFYHGLWKIFYTPGVVSTRDWYNIASTALGALIAAFLRNTKPK